MTTHPTTAHPIRQATVADSPEVARLVAMMFATIGVSGDRDEWLATVERALRDGIGGPARVLVIDDPERPGRLAAVGGGVVDVRLPRPGAAVVRAGYIQWMATDPSQQRRGHASRIVEALLTWFEEQQVNHVDLSATPIGESVYRAAGFKPPGSGTLLRWTR